MNPGFLLPPELRKNAQAFGQFVATRAAAAPEKAPAVKLDAGALLRSIKLPPAPPVRLVEPVDLSAVETQVKTLSVRVRDKHAKKLNQLAFEVNQVWNEANAQSADYSWVPIPGVGWIDCHTSAFDLQKEMIDFRKDRAPNLPSASYQEVIAVHAKARKQFKKNKLKWRCSGGPKRALGWLPFKQGQAKWKNGQVWFAGEYFKVWDSYGLSSYHFRSGSFSQDSRGRWYFNVVVHVPIQHNRSTSAVGIDLGLKDYATCSDGVKLEASQPYRTLAGKIGKAQRAKRKKQVRNLHAKVRNQRKDSIHKFTNKITSTHAVIVVGDVSSAKLVKTKMAKSVLDAGWSMLKLQLKYKALGQSAEFIEVNEAYSTQTCSCCGVIPDSSPKGRAGLEVRQWRCSDCGTEHDRDVNAAINILHAGLGCQAPLDGIRSL
jgi:IS605 OrfB family transposase